MEEYAGCRQQCRKYKKKTVWTNGLNSIKCRFAGTSAARASTGLRNHITSTNGWDSKLARTEHDVNYGYCFIHLSWGGYYYSWLTLHRLYGAL